MCHGVEPVDSPGVTGAGWRGEGLGSRGDRVEW